MHRDHVARRLRCVTLASALAACAGADRPPAGPAPAAPAAPPAPPAPVVAAPSAGTPTTPRVEIPEFMRITGDHSRTVFVTGLSDLIWPQARQVPGRIDLQGKTIWSGQIFRGDVVPEVLSIDLDAPLPRTGTLHATVFVGEREYKIETEARAGEFLEIRCGTHGPTLGWNPGYKYK